MTLADAAIILRKVEAFLRENRLLRCAAEDEGLSLDDLRDDLREAIECIEREARHE